MIDMSDKNYIIGLKSNMHATFDSPQGKEVLKFLEQACGWYRSIYTAGISSEEALINDGKRQVLATIKSILELTPEQIMAVAEKEV